MAVATIFYQKLRLDAAKQAQKSHKTETQIVVDPEQKKDLAELVQRPQPRIDKADETKATKKKTPNITNHQDRREARRGTPRARPD